MAENLTLLIVSPTISFVSVLITTTFLQSAPPSEILYATKLASFEKLTPAKEVVPSFENLFGSRKTSDSLLSKLLYKIL